MWSFGRSTIFSLGNSHSAQGYGNATYLSRVGKSLARGQAEAAQLMPQSLRWPFGGGNCISVCPLVHCSSWAIRFATLSLTFPICGTNGTAHIFDDRSEKRLGRILKCSLTLTCLQGCQFLLSWELWLWDVLLFIHSFFLSFFFCVISKYLILDCLLNPKSHEYHEWGDEVHSQLSLSCMNSNVCNSSSHFTPPSCFLFCTVRTVSSLQITDWLEVQRRQCMHNLFQSLKN